MKCHSPKISDPEKVLGPNFLGTLLFRDWISVRLCAERIKSERPTCGPKLSRDRNCGPKFRSTFNTPLRKAGERVSIGKNQRHFGPCISVPISVLGQKNSVWISVPRARISLHISVPVHRNSVPDSVHISVPAVRNSVPISARTFASEENVV